MARSLRKGPFIDVKLYKKLLKADRNRQGPAAKTKVRSSMIIPMMVGFTIGVHNGKDFIPVVIVPDIR